MAVSEDLEAKQESAHLKEIEEFVFDQDLVISYKKLSKLLNIHVNKAKRLLNVFVENANRGKRPISVTYVVSGEQASDLDTNVNPWRVCVVPEKKLEATKQLFLPDTMSVHVFSVHQGSEVQDNAMLLEASKCSDYSSGISAIRNEKAVPYDDEQMQQLMKKVQLTATVQVPAGFANKKPAPKPAPEVAKPVAKEPPVQKVEEKPAESKETEGAKNVTKPTGGTISGMFAAQSNNKAAPSKPAAPATNNKKGGKKVAGTSSITSFFQRQKDAPPKPPPQKKEEVVVNIEEESEKSDDNAKESSSPEQKNKSSPSQSEAVVTNGKGKGTSNSKASKAASKRPASKSQNKKKDDTAKRRKRIIALTDSESSDEEGRDEEMQVDSPPPPVSVEVEDEQPAVQEKPSEGIVKERRLVDKVYQDEKGFIVTKKEWVVETRKVEDVPEKETKKSPEKEKPAPVKRKQQSDIMSFFGRK